MIKFTDIINESKKQEYNGAVTIKELDDYINMCVRFSERLNPEIYIERFTSQSPAKLLIAPEWGLKNYVVRDMIIKRFNECETYQGRLYRVKQIVV